MRVCLISLDFPPYRSSGLTLYAENVARGLVERGHRVCVLAAQRGGARAEGAPPAGVEVVRLPVGRTDWLGLGWQAGRYLRRYGADFDVLHFADVHFAYACPMPFLTSAFQSFRQRLTADHGRPYHRNPADLAWRIMYYSVSRALLEQPSVRRARHFLMPSCATRQEFLTHYGVREKLTTLVYLGIDLGRFSRLPAPAKARRELGLPPESQILLYVGFSTPRKGVQYLAEALRRLPPSTYLVMVGKWEKGYRERFMAALGPAESRVRLTGYVDDEELLKYYAAADVFVLPTLLEGFGIPLVEAMAAGLPVVTTWGGSAGEVTGEGGLAVPPGDGAALQSAIERVLSDARLAEQLSLKGQARAQELFELKRMAAAVEAVYLRETR